MSLSIQEPRGKVRVCQEGLCFDYNVSLLRTRQALIPHSRVSQLRLMERKDSPNSIEFLLDGETWLMFVPNWNSEEILDRLENPTETCSVDSSDEASISDLIGRLGAVHSKLAASCLPANEGQGTKRLSYSAESWDIMVSSNFIHLTPFSMKLKSPGVMITHDEFTSIAVKQSTILKFQFFIACELRDGLQIAFPIKKSIISDVLALMKDTDSRSQSLPPKRSSEEGQVLLRMNDYFRKQSKDWVDVETSLDTDTKVNHSQANELNTITQKLRASSRVWRRVKTSWLEIESKAKTLSQVEDHLNNLDIAAAQHTGEIFRVPYCGLLETRKGVRVVQRNSSSYRSGGSVGGGIRVGGVGIGGSSSSGSSSSKSTTTYFPAPDELTEIESGQLFIRPEMMMFVGEQFNRQVNLKKLAHFAFDFDNLYLQIVPPTKEKNYYISFSSMVEFTTVRVILESLIEISDEERPSNRWADIESAVAKTRMRFLAQERSDLAFAATRVLAIARSADPESTEELESWVEQLEDE